MGRKTDRLIKATPQLDATERAINHAIHHLTKARETLRRFPCQRDPTNAAVAKLEKKAAQLDVRCKTVQKAAEAVVAAGCD